MNKTFRVSSNTTEQTVGFDVIRYFDSHAGVVTSIQDAVPCARFTWLSLVSWGSRRAWCTRKSKHSSSHTITVDVLLLFCCGWFSVCILSKGNQSVETTRGALWSRGTGGTW